MNECGDRVRRGGVLGWTPGKEGERAFIGCLCIITSLCFFPPCLACLGLTDAHTHTDNTLYNPAVQMRFRESVPVVLIQARLPHPPHSTGNASSTSPHRPSPLLHTMSSKLTDLVTDLAIKLEKACEPSQLDAARAQDLLGELEEIDMTIDLLKLSKAGFAVKKCKAVKAEAGAFDAVCERAALLLKKWKKAVASPSGGGGGGGGGASSSSSSNGRGGLLQSQSTDSIGSAAAATSASSSNNNNDGGAGEATSASAASSSSSSSSSSSAAAPPAAPPQPPAGPPTVTSYLAQSEAAALDLPPARLKIANLFLALFLKYPEGQEDASRAARVAVDIERAMQDVADYRNASKQYGDKARSLKYNLDMNEHLRLRVVLSDLPPTTLVGMKPEDMQPEEHRQAAEAAAAFAYEANLLDWQDKNAEKIRAKLGIEDVGGSFTCGRCKGNKTTYQAKQTRSSDEPMTMFVRCMTCGNRWKE